MLNISFVSFTDTFGLIFRATISTEHWPLSTTQLSTIVVAYSSHTALVSGTYSMVYSVAASRGWYWRKKRNVNSKPTILVQKPDEQVASREGFDAKRKSDKKLRNQSDVKVYSEFFFPRWSLFASPWKETARSIYRLGQKSDIRLVFEFSILLDALYFNLCLLIFIKWRRSTSVDVKKLCFYANKL